MITPEEGAKDRTFLRGFYVKITDEPETKLEKELFLSEFLEFFKKIESILILSYNGEKRKRGEQYEGSVSFD